MRGAVRSWSLVGVVVGLMVLAPGGRAVAAAVCAPPLVGFPSPCTGYSDPKCSIGGLSTTVSTHEFTTNIAVAAPLQTIETYRTQVTGMDGASVLFDATIDAPSNAAAINAAIAQATSAISSTGKTPTDPTVAASTRTLVASHTVASAPVTSDNVTNTITNTIGPTTINAGVESCYAWIVPAGWANIDDLITTEHVSTVTSTTTVTYLTFVVIQINASQVATAVTASPSFTG